LHCSLDHRQSPSSPTRRSSDLTPWQTELRNRAGRTAKIVVRVFGVNADFNRRASAYNLLLRKGERFPRCDANLLLNEIDAGHLLDRKSTRLNSSHVKISYAVFC